MNRLCECGILFDERHQGMQDWRQQQFEKLKEEGWVKLKVTPRIRTKIIAEYLYNTLARKKSPLVDNKAVIQFLQQEIDMIPLDLRSTGNEDQSIDNEVTAD